METHLATFNPDEREERYYELFCIAILKGVEMSEKTEEELDKKHEGMVKDFLDAKPLTELEKAIKKQDDAKSSAAILSTKKGGMMPDGTPRYVTPEQIDPLTGKYKK